MKKKVVQFATNLQSNSCADIVKFFLDFLLAGLTFCNSLKPQNFLIHDCHAVRKRQSMNYKALRNCEIVGRVFFTAPAVRVAGRPRTPCGPGGRDGTDDGGGAGSRAHGNLALRLAGLAGQVPAAKAVVLALRARAGSDLGPCYEKRKVNFKALKICIILFKIRRSFKMSN